MTSTCDFTAVQSHLRVADVTSKAVVLILVLVAVVIPILHSTGTNFSRSDFIYIIHSYNGYMDVINNETIKLSRSDEYTVFK